MSFVIQLFFDRRTEEAVRAVSKTLFEPAVNDPSESRPHISIASCNRLKIDSASEAVRLLAAEHCAFHLTFDSVGSFLSPEGVVFLAPIVQSRLLDVHRAAMHIVQTYGSEINHYYMPGRWSAHCSLASHLAPEAVGEAVRQCIGSLSSFDARVESLGLVEFGGPQSVIHACFPLRNTGDLEQNQLG